MYWTARFDVCCFLDNHQYPSAYNSFECLAGAGCLQKFEALENFFPSLSSFVEKNDDWIFGHFSYDLKNKIETGLFSQNTDKVQFPECVLFVPRIVLKLSSGSLSIGVIDDNADEIFTQITAENSLHELPSPVAMKPGISKEAYVDAVRKLQHHIGQGDCYEINFCQELFANASINPVAVYEQLNAVSPNPFSAFYKVEDHFLLCASPERYLKKEGQKIISQPIKGTSARDTNNEIDSQNRQQLLHSAKDRSENVMIVDLVRNDLSKVCEEGSVGVDELFSVYTFPSVHQMISTVSGTLKADTTFADILQATFPMGSMTGAPKRKVMQLIEQYESSKRGIYSGAVGYISPEKDVDFNVVIRSLVYNNNAQYLSFHVGSAITSYSDPEKEYEECLLKGEAIMKVFSEK